MLMVTEVDKGVGERLVLDRGDAALLAEVLSLPTRWEPEMARSDALSWGMMSEDEMTGLPLICLDGR